MLLFAALSLIFIRGHEGFLKSHAVKVNFPEFGKYNVIG